MHLLLLGRGVELERHMPWHYCKRHNTAGFWERDIVDVLLISPTVVVAFLLTPLLPRVAEVGVLIVVLSFSIALPSMEQRLDVHLVLELLAKACSRRYPFDFCSSLTL